MKVLYLTGIPAPYRVDLFNEMGKMMDLTVYFLGTSQSFRDKDWQSSHIKNFKGIFLSEKEYNNSLNIKTLKELRKHRKEYDLIVIHGYSNLSQTLSLFYLYRTDSKVLIEVDGGLIRDESKIKYRLKRFILSKADGWLSTGQKTTEYLRYYGAKEDKIYLYPFTSLYTSEILDTIPSKEEKDSFRKKLNMKGDYVVLSVGRVVPGKGFDILIQSTDYYPDNTDLYIVGGEVTDELKPLMKERQNVHFIPFLRKEELEDYYYAADVFVFPTRSDVWGLVINEAFSKGLPVISSDQSVAAIEMLKKGIVVPSEDIQAFGKETRALLLDEKQRTMLAEYALDISKEYTIEKSAVTHMEIFNYVKERKN